MHVTYRNYKQPTLLELVNDLYQLQWHKIAAVCPSPTWKMYF